MQEKECVFEVPLKKAEFVDIINRLKDSSEVVDKVDEIFRNSREKLETDFLNGAGLQISHEGIVVKLLEKLMRDKSEIISYFIYELEYGKEYREGCFADKSGNIDISTSEKLYDVLISGYWQKDNTESDSYADGIKALIEATKGLSEWALAIYEPIVNDICSRDSAGKEEVEEVLDWLVSTCISDDMIKLFKRVCNKFDDNYPKLIKEYVLLYKEMYEK